MAKIINIFDSKVQEKKNDWRKVLTGKEYEVLKYNSFTVSSKWSFPVCNHRECVTKDNIGYVQGMLADNRPFEAELFLGNNECSIGLIMPVIDAIESMFNNDKAQNTSFLKDEKSNVLGFVRQAETQDNGILPIGMVELGEIDDLGVISQYVEFLEDIGVIRFLSSERNGYVEYYRDVQGSNLVRVVVTLQYENGESVATTPFMFRRFGSGELVDAYYDSFNKKMQEVEKKILLRPDRKLNNRVLNKLEPKDIAFIEFAEEGACGMPGTMSIYVREKGKGVCYSGNFVYDDSIDEKKVERLMGPLLASFFERGLTKGPFKHYYMGLGNHLYVNRKYSAEVDCLKEILSEDGLFSRKKAIAYMLLDRS